MKKAEFKKYLDRVVDAIPNEDVDLCDWVATLRHLLQCWQDYEEKPQNYGWGEDTRSYYM